MKLRTWANEEIYFERDAYFEALFRAIDSASRSIDLETYIFEWDRVGLRMMDRLRAAAARGVRVRLVLDGLGTWFTQERIREALSGSKVELRIFHPFSLFGFTFSQFNRRLHRKVCVVDQRTCFVGSFNICDLPNRDTAVRLTGGAIWVFVHAFERLWKKRSGFARRGSRGFSLVRLNETQKMRRICNHDLARRIRTAKSRIWVTNAYFVPPLFLLRELCYAGLRGVDVRLLLPEHPDHAFMKSMATAFYRTLMLSRVRIHEYRDSFLHAKTWLVDDWALVGSTNLNHRSLIHDLEVDVVLLRPESREILGARFLKDLEQSTELRLEQLRYGLLTRLFRWFLLIFRFYA
jgi:cardiolipin synthase